MGRNNRNGTLLKLIAFKNFFHCILYSMLKNAAFSIYADSGMSFILQVLMKPNQMLFGTRLIWRTQDLRHHKTLPVQFLGITAQMHPQTQERITLFIINISKPQNLMPVNTDLIVFLMPTPQRFLLSASWEVMGWGRGRRVPAALSVAKPSPHASTWRSISASIQARGPTRAYSAANASTATLISFHTSAATQERSLTAAKSAASHTLI